MNIGLSVVIFQIPFHIHLKYQRRPGVVVVVVVGYMFCFFAFLGCFGFLALLCFVFICFRAAGHVSTDGSFSLVCERCLVQQQLIL
jgi:hypothetical protein